MDSAGGENAAAVWEDGFRQINECEYLVWQAVGTLKANLRRVSLADCFAIELAARLNATILTADHHEFDVLAEQPDYAIKFIR